jgi:hypothetical protein
MEYKEKYFKYKKKYLNLKNNFNNYLKGGYIIPSRIDKFQVSEFHGSLNVDDSFVVPDNVYIIESNTCSLSNREYLKDLFVSQDNNTTKSYEEILNDFNRNQQYTIIEPNTNICNVKLLGKFHDFSILGIFNINQNENYFKNIILNNAPDIIIDNLKNFITEYKEDYKTNKMIKLEEFYSYKIESTTHYVNVINQFKQIKFDFRYLIAFISFIQDSVSSDKSKYIGILTKDILTKDYTEYNKVFDLSQNNINLFDTIEEIFSDRNNIKSFFTECIEDEESFNKFPDPTIESYKLTYFEIFMRIFSILFLNYFNKLKKYETTLKTEIMKLHENTERFKISIFFNGACLSIPTQINDTTTKKIEICQLKLVNKEKISVLLKEINPELYIYNILLNDIDTIYNTISKISSFTYQQNFYNKFLNLNHREFDAYLLPLILIIEILFFKPSTQTLINITKEYIKMYRKQKPVKNFRNFKFYELIFKIYFEYNNNNIYQNIYQYFKDIFELININFLNSFDEQKKVDIDVLQDIFVSYPLELPEYRNMLIHTINYFYINNILDLKKIEEIQISSDDLFSKHILEKNKKDFIIKDEYLNKKLKGLEIKICLFKLNIESLKEKRILPDIKKGVDINYIYTLSETYDNTVMELFDFFYKL